MAKIYVLISALILLAMLLFNPLLSPGTSAEIGASSHGVQGWVAGPGGEGA